MYLFTEKFDTLRPAKSPKRFLKSKILQGLGATSGGWAPFPANTERNIERKILLQSNGLSNPMGGGGASTLRNGLVSYWKFDELVAGNRADSVGSNTFVQGTQTFPAITGLLANAVGSVGPTPTGRLHADSFPSDSSFSFTLWFRYQGGQIGASPIIAKVLGSPTGGGYALINGSGGGGTANWNIYNASGTIVNSCTNGATVVQGTWMHCVLVFDASTNKALQYNNAVLGTQSGSGTPGSNSASLTVQTWSDNSTGAGSCCDIDEMGYYNRALNAGEVTKLFNGGTPLPLSLF